MADHDTKQRKQDEEPRDVTGHPKEGTAADNQGNPPPQNVGPDRPVRDTQKIMETGEPGKSGLAKEPSRDT